MTSKILLKVPRRYLARLNINHSTQLSLIHNGPNSEDCRSFDVRALDFENFKTAYHSKSSWEIFRALTVLKMCSIQTFVNNSQKIMQVFLKHTNDKVVNATVRKTFYDQFVGGDNPNVMQDVVGRLTKVNIKPMIVCTMEEDVGESKGEDIYERNLQRLRECLELVSSLQSDAPLMQVKMTSIISAEVLMNVSKIFSTTKNPMLLVENMAECTLQKKSLLINGLGSMETIALENGLQRMYEVAQIAKRNGIRLLIDAEYSYVNAGINAMALPMMAIFNREQPLIWNTYQCYLRSAITNLKQELDITRSIGVCFGAKLVRGAYITLENERAKLLGLASPVWESYEQTNGCYNEALNILLEEVKHSPKKTTFVAATHNEESIVKAIEKIIELNLTRNEVNQINFGQLYGMCDQVTFPLASLGFNVYKSIPYGPLNEALPYLARRATENQTIFAGAKKERHLLQKALKERVKEAILPQLL